jgi:hypothetical protein
MSCSIGGAEHRVRIEPSTAARWWVDGGEPIDFDRRLAPGQRCCRDAIDRPRASCRSRATAAAGS